MTEKREEAMVGEKKEEESSEHSSPNEEKLGQGLEKGRDLD